MTTLAIAGALVLFILCFCFGGTSNDLAGSGPVPVSGWRELQADGTYAEVAVPIDFGRKERILIQTTLPEVHGGQALMVKVNFSDMTVSVDGKTIYEVGPVSLGRIRTMVGNFIAFVPLLSEYSGKEIQLDIGVRDARFTSAIKHTNIVTRSEYLVSLVQKHWFNLIIACLYCLLGLMMLVLWIIVSSRERTTTNSTRKVYGYSSLFLFSVGLWIISDVHLLGIFLERLTSSGLFNYLVFNLLPIGLVGLTCYAYAQYGTAVRIVFRVVQLNFIVQCVLFLTGVCDYSQMLPVTQLLCVISMVTFIVPTILDYVRNPITEKRLIIIFTCGICVMVTIAIVMYLLDKSIFPWMALTFVVLVTCVIGKLMTITYKMMRDGIKVEEMRIHAYTDDLTGLSNRRAFTEEIERIQEQGAPADLVIAQLDINGLKLANDTYGHEVGDELIKAVAACMRTSFDPFATCYRIGGDEFSVISNVDGQRFDQGVTEFEEYLLQWRGVHIQSPSVSIGFARQSEYPGVSIADLSKIADKRMYEEKRAYYTQNRSH